MKKIKVNNLRTIINKKQQPLIAIWGFFDGWHQGHQAILKQLKMQAKSLNYQTLVISFNIKPQAVLLNQNFTILFDNETKQQFLINNGIDNYWELQFTKELASNSAEVFIEWLVKNQVKAAIVNPNIRFGYQGQGNINTLKSSTLQIFTCDNILDNKKQRIASGYIKKLLLAKNIKAANECLNNVAYTITGTVVDGIKEGRTLGFPTANLALKANYALPGLATYLTLTKVDRIWYQSLTIIIIRNNQPLVETYLLDFNKNIYGKVIQVRFLDYLRDNIIFNNKNDLIKQIQNDEKEAVKYFTTYNYSN